MPKELTPGLERKRQKLIKFHESYTEHDHFILLKNIKIPTRIAKAAAELFTKNEVLGGPCESLYFHGPTGSGKTTHAVASILRNIKAWETNMNFFGLGSTYKFISCSEMLDQIRNSYGKPNFEANGQWFTESEVLVEKFKQVDLLIVDDFGVENITEWAFQTLYMILSYRYDWELQTIYTSNFSLNEISKKIGDDRLTSRIEHQCRIINFDGKDFRKIK